MIKLPFRGAVYILQIQSRRWTGVRVEKRFRRWRAAFLHTSGAVRKKFFINDDPNTVKFDPETNKPIPGESTFVRPSYNPVWVPNKSEKSSRRSKYLTQTANNLKSLDMQNAVLHFKKPPKDKRKLLSRDGELEIVNESLEFTAEISQDIFQSKPYIGTQSRRRPGNAFQKIMKQSSVVQNMQQQHSKKEILNESSKETTQSSQHESLLDNKDKQISHQTDSTLKTATLQSSTVVKEIDKTEIYPKNNVFSFQSEKSNDPAQVLQLDNKIGDPNQHMDGVNSKKGTFSVLGKGSVSQLASQEKQVDVLPSQNLQHSQSDKESQMTNKIRHPSTIKVLQMSDEFQADKDRRHHGLSFHDKEDINSMTRKLSLPTNNSPKSQEEQMKLTLEMATENTEVSEMKIAIEKAPDAQNKPIEKLGSGSISGIHITAVPQRLNLQTGSSSQTQTRSPAVVQSIKKGSFNSHNSQSLIGVQARSASQDQGQQSNSETTASEKGPQKNINTSKESIVWKKNELDKEPSKTPDKKKDKTVKDLLGSSPEEPKKIIVKTREDSTTESPKNSLKEPQKNQPVSKLTESPESDKRDQSTTGNVQQLTVEKIELNSKKIAENIPQTTVSTVERSATDEFQAALLKEFYESDEMSLSRNDPENVAEETDNKNISVSKSVDKTVSDLEVISKSVDELKTTVPQVQENKYPKKKIQKEETKEKINEPSKKLESVAKKSEKVKPEKEGLKKNETLLNDEFVNTLENFKESPKTTEKKEQKENKVSDQKNKEEEKQVKHKSKLIHDNLLNKPIDSYKQEESTKKNLETDSLHLGKSTGIPKDIEEKAKSVQNLKPVMGTKTTKDFDKNLSDKPGIKALSSKKKQNLNTNLQISKQENNISGSVESKHSSNESKSTKEPEIKESVTADSLNKVQISDKESSQATDINTSSTNKNKYEFKEDKTKDSVLSKDQNKGNLSNLKENKSPDNSNLMSAQNIYDKEKKLLDNAKNNRLSTDSMQDFSGTSKAKESDKLGKKSAKGDKGTSSSESEPQKPDKKEFPQRVSEPKTKNEEKPNPEKSDSKLGREELLKIEHVSEKQANVETLRDKKESPQKVSVVKFKNEENLKHEEIDSNLAGKEHTKKEQTSTKEANVKTSTNVQQTIKSESSKQSVQKSSKSPEINFVKAETKPDLTTQYEDEKRQEEKRQRLREVEKMMRERDMEVAKKKVLEIEKIKSELVEKIKEEERKLKAKEAERKASHRAIERAERKKAKEIDAEKKLADKMVKKYDQQRMKEEDSINKAWKKVLDKAEKEKRKNYEVHVKEMAKVIKEIEEQRMKDQEAETRVKMKESEKKELKNFKEKQLSRRKLLKEQKKSQQKRLKDLEEEDRKARKQALESLKEADRSKLKNEEFTEGENPYSKQIKDNSNIWKHNPAESNPVEFEATMNAKRLEKLAAEKMELTGWKTKESNIWKETEEAQNLDKFLSKEDTEQEQEQQWDKERDRPLRERILELWKKPKDYGTKAASQEKPPNMWPGQPPKKTPRH